MSELYRVGNHQPQNLYRGDEYIGVMFDPADAALVRDVLNRVEPEAVGPEMFRDAEGDTWTRMPNGYWSMTEEDTFADWTLERIKATYGTWACGGGS